VTGTFDAEVAAIAWEVVVSHVVDGDEVSETIAVRVPEGGTGRATVVLDEQGS
jgi:hypothetical protein